MKQEELILNLTFEKSFQINFKSKFLTSFPKTKIKKVALLVSNEYEGIYKNGGIGTYYNALSQKLAAEGWYVMLLLTNTESNFNGKSKLPALKHVFSTHEVEQVLHLQPVHLDILSKLQPYITDYQSFCCLFFLQAVVNSFKDAHVYAEFHELNGIGYRPIQAKNSALLGHNCVTAVTIHSGHEWIFEANERFIEEYPSWFWHVCHCEQYSFENADLAFFPSHYLKSKVESYGWKTSHALHLPYFIPLIKLIEKKVSSHLKIDITNDRLPLVFFGRFEERKGLRTFVEAVKLLAADLRQKIQIIFIGKIVSLQSLELQHLNSQQYIEQELRSDISYSIYTNFFSQEAIEFVSNLHHPLVCLTSPQENFPNTALEMGQLPVSLIVSDTGGFRETLQLINRSSDVHWFQPANSHSLAQVIAQAISTYPENPQIPDRASLEQVNQHLLHQRIEYINHAFSKLAPTQKQPKKVTIGVTCSQLSTDLLDCLKSLDVQTYKCLEVIVLEAANKDDCMHELIAQAKSLFPHYKFLKYDPTLAKEAAQNYLVEIAQGEYFLPFPSGNIALPFMIEKLVSAICESNAAVVVCPQAKIGTSIDFNFLGGSLPQLLNFNQVGDVCCLFTRELLQEFQCSDRNVIAHSLHILAAAVATGKRITYYSYPIYLSRVVDSTTIHANLPRERYYLRQYLSQIEPSKWSQRQIYMLLTAVQQLLNSEEQLQSDLYQAQAKLERSHAQLPQIQNELMEGSQATITSILNDAQFQLQETKAELERSQATITSMQTSKFWKFQTKWYKLRKFITSK